MRIIFAGSSALSSKSVKLAAMMSRVREKMPMLKLLLGNYALLGGGAGAGSKGETRPGRGHPSKYYFDGTQ